MVKHRDQHRWNIEREGGLLVVEQFQLFCGIECYQRDQRAADVYRKQDCTEAPGDVKKRHRRYVAVILAQPAENARDVSLIDHRVVRQHHTFWKPRRPAGVLYLDHIVWVETRLSLYQPIVRQLGTQSSH